MTRRLNIVLLVLDTQRADRLSCYGYPAEISPHLDVFAAEATRFSSAIAPAQWTVPTHASIFTGLYPSQHTMFQLDSVLPETIPTLAERLQEGGYLTTGFSDNPLVGLTANGLGRGFIQFRHYQNGRRLYLPPGNGLDSVKGHWGRFRRQWVKLTYYVHRMVDSVEMRQSIFERLASAFKLVDYSQVNRSQTLDDAAQLLINRPGVDADQPIFVFINLMGVHPPYNPPRWALQRFAPTLLNHPQAGAVLERINAVMLQDYGWLGPFLKRSLDDEHLLLLNEIYNAEVAAQDARVGSFIQDLHAAGVLTDTLFIVVADHGDHLGEKLMLGHASGVYNQVIWVPLLIRDPHERLPPGKEISAFISTRSLFHTILDAGGVATVEEEALTLPHLISEGNHKLDDVFAEARPIQRMLQRLQRKYPDLSAIHRYDQLCRAIYQDDYKLITIGDQRIELYKIRNDLEELYNLQTAMPDWAKTLYRYLQSFVEEAQPATTSAVKIDPDALVERRLRDLGYLS